MVRSAASPYHLGPQSARALLPPIQESLERIEARLAQYVERIPMGEFDREVLARAREVIQETRRRLDQIASEIPTDRA